MHSYDYVTAFLNKYLAACLQVDKISLLLLSVQISGLYRIQYFSQVQRLHFLLMLLQLLALLTILHVMLKFMLSSFNFHTSLLSSVDCRLPICLNEDLWLAYLVLKVPSVRPTYLPAILLLSMVPVAWYIIDLVRHCLSSGHNSALRQLQVLLLSILASFLRNMLVLWAFIFCCMLLMQLQLTLTVFLLKIFLSL